MEHACTIATTVFAACKLRFGTKPAKTMCSEISLFTHLQQLAVVLMLLDSHIDGKAQLDTFYTVPNRSNALGLQCHGLKDSLIAPRHAPQTTG